LGTAPMNPYIAEFMKTIKDAEAMLSQGNVKEAERMYAEIGGRYSSLPYELKQKVFNRCLPLIDKLLVYYSKSVQGKR